MTLGTQRGRAVRPLFIGGGVCVGEVHVDPLTSGGAAQVHPVTTDSADAAGFEQDPGRAGRRELRVVPMRVGEGARRIAESLLIHRQSLKQAVSRAVVDPAGCGRQGDRQGCLDVRHRG
ncbi:hypothetical protein GQ85_01325 [Rhodococcus rhodochrous]|nr:hypothetical protein GQ85_01325 [Rhodococcus rhodochrous]